jgi:hypothetical protein
MILGLQRTACPVHGPADSQSLPGHDHGRMTASTVRHG